MRSIKNVLKRTLSLVMIAAVTLTTVCVAGLKLNASAQALDYLSYKTTDGEVTITSCNTAAEGEIIIPDEIDGYPVTKLQNYVFDHCELITSVTIPVGVTEVPYCAFYMCTNLNSVNLPKNLKTIGYMCFSGCSSLKNIEIPSTVEKIDVCAFSRCTALEQLVLPETLTYIGSQAFFECKNLRQLNLPGSLNYIGDCAFQNCGKWSGEVVIPSGVTSIAGMTFWNCSSLKKIVMHDDITYIGAHAFFNCKCEPFVLPAGLKTLDKNAFHWRDVQLPLPDGLETIGDGAFNGATFYDQGGNYARELVIPDSVKTIGNSAFESIGVYSSSMKKVSIPASVESIGDRAFSASIGFFEVDEANGYYSSDESGVLFNKSKTEIIMAPRNTDTSEYHIPDTVTKIYENAFSGVSFSKIYIPKSVSEIGYHAFGYSSCSAYLVDEDNQNFANDSYGGLCNKDFTEYISFPRGNTTANIVLPESIETVSPYAFNGDKYLTDLTMGDNLKTISEYAFYNCDYLNNITFSSNLEYIGNYAFSSCDVNGFTRLEIPDSVTYIGDSAFYNSDLEYIKLPAGLTEIQDSTFENNKQLKEIVIPKSVTTIGQSAFRSCYASILNVYYCGTQEDWLAIDFKSGNTALINSTIHYNYGKNSGTCGDGLTWYYDTDTKGLIVSGNGAMDDMPSFDDYGWYSFKDDIKFVELGDGVTSVGTNAFNGCQNLNEVYLGKSLKSVGDSAFADCPSLALVTVCSDGFNTSQSSFTGNDGRLTLIYNSANTAAGDYAAQNSVNAIPVEYDSVKKVLSFNGNLTVYDNLQYNFLSRLINSNQQAEYLFFNKIVFDGVMPDIISSEDLMHDTLAENLTFDNLYISLKVAKGDESESITFFSLLNLLRNGNYDAFMFDVNYDDADEHVSFIEVIKKAFHDLAEDALRIASKVINFFVRIIRR